MEKKYGGKIGSWQLHHLVIEEGQKESFDKIYPHLEDNKIQPMMMTGTVIEDATGRWEIGWHMRSSMIVKIDREKGIVETLNTIYDVDMETENQDTMPDLGNGVLSIFY